MEEEEWKPEPEKPEPVVVKPEEGSDDDYGSEDGEEEEESTEKTCGFGADRIAQNICQLLKDGGMCWAKATKSQCMTTCCV